MIHSRTILSGFLVENIFHFICTMDLAATRKTKKTELMNFQGVDLFFFFVFVVGWLGSQRTAYTVHVQLLQKRICIHKLFWLPRDSLFAITIASTMPWPPYAQCPLPGTMAFGRKQNFKYTIKIFWASRHRPGVGWVINDNGFDWFDFVCDSICRDAVVVVVGVVF